MAEAGGDIAAHTLSLVLCKLHHLHCVINLPYEAGIIIGSILVVKKPKSREMKSLLSQG